MYVVSSHIPYQFADGEYEFRCKSERVKVKLEIKLQAKIPPVDGVQLIPAMEFGAGNPLDKDAKQDS